MKKTGGKVFKYGDDVNTDVIIPARYCTGIEPAFLAEHCMEDIDRDFAAKVRPGDIVAAGKNFGCGSSREVAPLALKVSGVTAVIAVSFARIFFRNAVNVGLPAVVCPAAVNGLEYGGVAVVKLDEGIVVNGDSGKTFEFESPPPLIKDIYAAGGLKNYVGKMMGSR